MQAFTPKSRVFDEEYHFDSDEDGNLNPTLHPSVTSNSSSMHIQYGTELLLVPRKLGYLSLRDIINYRNFESLSDKEKNILFGFLPQNMDNHECLRTLFNDDNVNFGNDIDR